MVKVSRAHRQVVRSSLSWVADFLMIHGKLKAGEAKQIIRQELDSV